MWQCSNILETLNKSNTTHKEMKSSLNCGNVCHHNIQNFSIPRLGLPYFHHKKSAHFSCILQKKKGGGDTSAKKKDEQIKHINSHYFIA